jgi:hypothetical protein
MSKMGFGGAERVHNNDCLTAQLYGRTSMAQDALPLIELGTTVRCHPARITTLRAALDSTVRTRPIARCGAVSQ